jgi:hypothetical protein
VLPVLAGGALAAAMASDGGGGERTGPGKAFYLFGDVSIPEDFAHPEPKPGESARAYWHDKADRGYWIIRPALFEWPSRQVGSFTYRNARQRVALGGDLYSPPVIRGDWEAPHQTEYAIRDPHKGQVYIEGMYAVRGGVHAFDPEAGLQPETKERPFTRAEVSLALMGQLIYHIFGYDRFGQTTIHAVRAHSMREALDRAYKSPSIYGKDPIESALWIIRGGRHAG